MSKNLPRNFLFFSTKIPVGMRENLPVLFFIFKWLLICTVVGGCIGTASAGFLFSLVWATDFRESHIWIIMLLPVAGFLVGLLYHYFGKNVAAGNNLLIDTIHEPNGTIPLRMAPLVYLGTVATHLFGGSVGREGTALQMAGAIADQFSNPFKLSTEERKILLIAAIAGGFSSVFGTPLAGAIFGLEVYMIGKIRYNALFPAFACAVVADLVTRLWHAQHTHYHINFVPNLSYENIAFAIVAGLFFGVCAGFFGSALEKLGSIFSSKIKYPPLRPVFGGIIVAAAVFAMGTTKYIGLGIPTIVQAFGSRLPPYDFALKIAFTVVSLAAGYKGGEVTPLFFIGATLGNALSIFLPLPTGLLAGMGFVAVFAGATNTPLACTFMAIELFGAECGVYAAIACIVSYLVSGNKGIYQRQMIGEPKHVHFSENIGKRLKDL